MDTKFQKPVNPCMIACIMAYVSIARSEQIAPQFSLVNGINDAIRIVYSSYGKASHGSASACHRSDVVGFALSSDFPPFGTKGQWCWEVDIRRGHSVSRVVEAEPGMALWPRERLSDIVMARVWINAESGELLYVAGGASKIPDMLSSSGEPLHVSGVNTVKQKPFTLSNAHIGTNRITHVAAEMFEKCFSMRLPKNKITHMKNIALEFDLDGFAKRDETIREIRFYANKGKEAFILTGCLAFTDLSDCEMWFEQSNGEPPPVRNMHELEKWKYLNNGSITFPFPKWILNAERKFHENRGVFLGTVWAKKHGNEVRFYFPMPDPEPAPQHAGKPSAKPDTNPDVQKPAAQKPSAQRPATAAPSAQKR